MKFITGIGIGLLFATAFAFGQGILAPQGSALTLYDQNGNSFTMPSTSGEVALITTIVGPGAFLMPYDTGDSATDDSSVIGLANEVGVYRKVIPFPITIDRIAFHVDTA